MPNLLRISITLSLLILLGSSGCSSRIPSIGLNQNTGFIELPFPSNLFKPGQIVEIYSSPQKVELTFQPDIPWDSAGTSRGWDISSINANSIRLNLESEINEIVRANTSASSNYRAQVEFTNTRTTVIPKNVIFRSLINAIEEDSSLYKLLTIYAGNGTRFDVITQTLSATVAFRIVDESNMDINFDSEVIEKINADLEAGFSRQGNSNRFISGEDLIVGIHYDPQMTREILNFLDTEN